MKIKATDHGLLKISDIGNIQLVAVVGKGKLPIPGFYSRIMLSPEVGSTGILVFKRYYDSRKVEEAAFVQYWWEGDFLRYDDGLKHELCVPSTFVDGNICIVLDSGTYTTDVGNNWPSSDVLIVREKEILLYINNDIGELPLIASSIFSEPGGAWLQSTDIAERVRNYVEQHSQPTEKEVHLVTKLREYLDLYSAPWWIRITMLRRSIARKKREISTCLDHM